MLVGTLAILSTTSVVFPKVIDPPPRGIERQNAFPIDWGGGSRTRYFGDFLVPQNSHILVQKVPELKLHHIDIRRAIDLLCKEVNLSSTLPNDLGGEVDTVLKSDTFETSMTALLKPWGYTFRLDNNLLVVTSVSSERPCPTPCKWVNANAREVIVHLLDSMDHDYWISPKLKNKINFRRTTQTFEDSFREVLSRAGATYERDEGVYLVYPANEKLPRFRQSQKPPEGILDGTLLYVQYTNANLREVVRDLLKDVGYHYSMQSEVQGTVNLKMRNLTPEYILECCLLDNNATFEINSGVVNISSIKP